MSRHGNIAGRNGTRGGAWDNDLDATVRANHADTAARHDTLQAVTRGNALDATVRSNHADAMARRDDLAAVARCDDLAATARRDVFAGTGRRDDLEAVARPDDLGGTAHRDDLEVATRDNDLALTAQCDELEAVTRRNDLAGAARRHHPAVTTRRNDIDWLRIGASYLLLVFHTLMVFNPAPFYHIRNDEVSIVAMVVAGFISLWHMPLFFVLAGWSLVASLRKRGSVGFLRERVRRLLVPLVAGCVLLMPPIKYVELRSGMDAGLFGLRVIPALHDSFASVLPLDLPLMEPFHEGFLQFLPTFFLQPGRFTWSHLWFLAYLLAFTLAYLPLFRWLLGRRFEPRRVPAVVVYLPILPLALVQVFLRPLWPGLQNLVDDWANVGFFSVFFLAGFAMACFPEFERAMHREWKRALALGVAAALLLLGGVLRVVSSEPLILATTAVAAWSFVVAILGIARQKLSITGAWLAYLRESAMPVYILHQSAIVLIGYWLIRLPLGIGAKFVLLLATASVATVATYHFLVRPWRVPRLLCGLGLRG